MPDSRTSRGPHPKDAACFAPAVLPMLRAAADDLCWLLSRGYPPEASLKLAGDRYRLRDRQRNALQRVVASAASLERRARGRIELEAADAGGLVVDGYNVLLTVEAALSGGLVLVGRDGAMRDLTAMSGHYRKVRQTRDALAAIGASLTGAGCPRARWLLDRPVSNSGRLRALVLDVAQDAGWRWEVELCESTDPALSEAPEPVATADSAILDRCSRWVNLARRVVEEHAPLAWVVEL